MNRLISESDLTDHNTSSHIHDRNKLDDSSNDYMTKPRHKSPGEFNTVRLNDPKIRYKNKMNASASNIKASKSMLKKHSPLRSGNHMNKKIMKAKREHKESRMSRREETTCESLFDHSQNEFMAKGISTIGDTYDQYNPPSSIPTCKKAVSSYKSLGSTMKHQLNRSSKKYREDRSVNKYKEERDDLRILLAQKDSEISRLKAEIAKSHLQPVNVKNGPSFDTLTTNNNDPLALKQELQDLNIMLDEVEQERDNAMDYIQKLEAELQKTKDVLNKNQLNLIEPLQEKIKELEKIVEEKEADIKKRYKWKLRKYKREIDMEKQINKRLKSKLGKDQARDQSKAKNYKTFNQFVDSRSVEKNRKSKKKLSKVDSKVNDENVNILNATSFSTTMRRNKSQTLNGNRALNIDELLKNNTPSQMNTQKNLKDYFMKFETTKIFENFKDSKNISPSQLKLLNASEYILKQREMPKPQSSNNSFVVSKQSKESTKGKKKKERSNLSKAAKGKRKTQKLDHNFFRKISNQISKN